MSHTAGVLRLHEWAKKYANVTEVSTVSAVTTRRSAVTTQHSTVTTPYQELRNANTSAFNVLMQRFYEEGAPHKELAQNYKLHVAIGDEVDAKGKEIIMQSNTYSARFVTYVMFYAVSANTISLPLEEDKYDKYETALDQKELRDGAPMAVIRFIVMDILPDKHMQIEHFAYLSTLVSTKNLRGGGKLLAWSLAKLVNMPILLEIGIQEYAPLQRFYNKYCFKACAENQEKTEVKFFKYLSTDQALTKLFRNGKEIVTVIDTDPTQAKSALRWYLRLPQEEHAASHGDSGLFAQSVFGPPAQTETKRRRT